MSFTLNTHNHRPIIYSFVVVDLNGEILLEERLIDKNGSAHVQFLNTLLEWENKLLDIAGKKFSQQYF